MAGASHRIGVLEIELRLEEEPQAHPLMDRVSALRAPRLEAVMQRVLDELSPAGQLDRIERVELDLGPLPLNDFDDAFLARLEPALRQALALQLQGQPATAPISAVLELLRLFARTGSLPWWAARSDPQLINAQIRRALELDPGAWWALVRELQAHPAALERLAAALPAEAPLGIEAEGPPPSPALPRATENEDDDAFLARLEPALRQALALQLQGQPATAPISAVLELLRLFARTGSLPWWAARSDPQLINAQIRRALELDPGAWWALVRELQAHPAALERLAAALPAEAPLGIEAEGPPPSPALPRATERDTAAGLRWLESAEASQKGMEGLEGGELAALSPEALQLLPEPGHRLALRRPGASHSSPRPAADPADPDELAIDDGGLVILWPLMDTLLSRLEYVDPELKLFASEAARNQAIALLSFLVEGEADPPEWRLALAKVLCGLSPLAPWRLNDPLMPEVLAEAERLLQTVIAHGDMAAELDVDDLRHLILRRPAVLTSRTGAWLLRVERRPEDGLLERFPWGWSWIRLPWMDHPLQVEW